MDTLVKITDKNHALYGKTLPGSLIYHDIHHTGNGPDLYVVLSNEKSHRLLSTQIDEDHYRAQLMAEQVARLGAKEGDTVLITRGGSGSYCHGWDSDKPHKITVIDFTGHVQFDGGIVKNGASIFRPEVKLVDQ
jgi:hypothetical protein